MPSKRLGGRLGSTRGSQSRRKRHSRGESWATPLHLERLENRRFFANGTLTFAPGETTKPVNVTINGDTTVEPDERFVVSLTNATNATLGTSQGIGTIVNDDVVTDNTPPVVTGFTINAGLSGGAQRSMVKNIRVEFSEAVDASLLDQNAFVLRRGGAVVPNLTINIEIAPDRMSAKITFGGSAVVAESLPDGHYTLTVPRARVRDDAGNVALADGSLAFDRRFGDVNGNGVTDSSDFVIMRAAVGKRSTDAGYIWFLDYDNDGLIGSTDYGPFGSRLNIRY